MFVRVCDGSCDVPSLLSCSLRILGRFEREDGAEACSHVSRWYIGDRPSCFSFFVQENASSASTSVAVVASVAAVAQQLDQVAVSESKVEAPGMATSFCITSHSVTTFNCRLYVRMLLEMIANIVSSVTCLMSGLCYAAAVQMSWELCTQTTQLRR